MKKLTGGRASGVWVAAVGTGAIIASTVTAAPLAQEQAAASVRSEGRLARVLAGVGGSHIGISIQDLEQADLDERQMQVEGALVTDVRAGSPASEAGLAPGDVVVEFDGERVRSARQLSRLVEETPAGRAVSAAAVRDGDRLQFDVVPEPGPGWLVGFERPLREVGRWGRHVRAALPHIVPDDFHMSLEFSPRRGRLGVEVVELSSQLADYFGVELGVLVNMVADGSVGAEVGLRAGDILTAIDGHAVGELGDLRRYIASVDSGETFSIRVVRDGDTVSLEARLD